MTMKYLAATMLRVYLASLVLSQEDFEEDEVAFWSALHSEAFTSLPKEIMAYKRAKDRLSESRAGNPQNIVAALLYNISRSGERDVHKKAAWEKRLEDGFSLKEIRRLDQALSLIEELRGAYLSERLIGRLVGRVVNLDRVSRLIREEYSKC